MKEDKRSIKKISILVAFIILVVPSTMTETGAAEPLVVSTQDDIPKWSYVEILNDIVWDNGEPSSLGCTSQLDTIYPPRDYIFNGQATDDFRFDDNTEISGVGWWGFFNRPDFGPFYDVNPCDFTIYFYADNGTGNAPTGGGMDDPERTALAVYNYEDVLGEYLVGHSYFYEVQFHPSFLAQHDVQYWIVIQAEFSFPPYWYWYITDHAMQLSSMAAGFMEFYDGTTYHPYIPYPFWMSSAEPDFEGYSLAFYLRGHSGSLGEDELDQNQLVQSDETCHAIGYIQDDFILQAAQSFVPTKSILTRVEVLISRLISGTSPLFFSIRDELHNENLVEASVLFNSIPPGGYSWIEFDFQDISVTPGETYYLVAYTKDASMTLYRWATNTSSNAYPPGNAWVSQDDGNTWNQSTNDMCFRSYGIPTTTLEIVNIVGGSGVRPTIVNSGTVPAINVNATLIITGGFSQQIDIEKSRFASTLDSDARLLLSSGSFVGFGPIDITVTVNSYNTESISEVITGFILGSYVLL